MVRHYKLWWKVKLLQNVSGGEGCMRRGEARDRGSHNNDRKWSRTHMSYNKGVLH